MKVAKRKILIEIERNNNTTENFKFGFGRILEKIGCKYRFCLLPDIKKEDLNWCDVYISVRPNSPISLSIAKAIKKSGRTYIVYFDDDLLNRENSIKWRQNSSRECLKLSDCIFGANPALCEEYGKLSKAHFSVNTAVEEDELSNPAITASQIQIVYAAGKDHATIFEKFIKPTLMPLIEEYRERIHFVFIGVEPRVAEIGSELSFSFIPLMPLDRYIEYMKTHHFDIGLAPLENDRFSNMKYFNKYIEYSKSAIAGIYSDVRPYTYVVHNGANGFLVNNNCIDWYGRIKLCIDNIDDTRRIGLTAQEDLKSRFNLKSITQELEKNLDAVLNSEKYSEVRWSKRILTEKLFYIVDKMGKVYYHTHDRGIGETIRMIRGRRNQS